MIVSQVGAMPHYSPKQTATPCLRAVGDTMRVGLSPLVNRRMSVLRWVSVHQPSGTSLRISAALGEESYVMNRRNDHVVRTRDLRQDAAGRRSCQPAQGLSRCTTSMPP
jgi:hypothetical protein